MARTRIAMESIREVLRLRAECGCSQREIAQSCGLSLGAVHKVLALAEREGLGWPLPEGLAERQLQERLYGPEPERRRKPPRAAPDFATAHRQLQRRKHLTLQLLWSEYREQHPEDKLYVDYAGQTVPVDAGGAEGARAAQIFVAVLGASSYVYAEASWGQDEASWIGSHVRALEHLGGAPRSLVPDNLKAGVTRASRYEPQVNRSYREMARHYGLAVLPARPSRPRDKAKAEAGVQVVERSLLEPLRHRRFASLAELNAALAERLPELNGKRFQKREGTRAQLLEELDRPALRPLPEQRYEYAEWKRARVNVDYHVAAGGRHYSVPCELVGRQVDVRLTEKCVEILLDGRRVAQHARGRGKGGATTDPAHRPRSHREHGAWPPERIQGWARKVGPETGRLVRELLDGGAHPQERYRPCLGILRLGERYGHERMEAAARRALHFGRAGYRGVKRILESGADREPLEDAAGEAAPVAHGNVRGGAYFKEGE